MSENFEFGDWYVIMLVAQNTSNSLNSSPNRTHLNISQDPEFTRDEYNELGPSRSNVNPCDIYNQKNERILKISHDAAYTKVTNELLDENESTSISSSNTVTKSRRRKNPNPKYELAVIISGFKKNHKLATKIYSLWNEHSRGAIPRTALAKVLATKFNLKIYVDMDVIFNQRLYFNKFDFSNKNLQLSAIQINKIEDCLKMVRELKC